MTSPDLSRAGRDRPVQVRSQGELIAAVPALIGFHPHRSLVLVATGGASGGRIGLVVRLDLPPPDEVPEAAEAAVAGLLLDEPDGAVVLVVCPDDPEGRPDVRQDGPAPPPHAALVGQVVDALEAQGVRLHSALWAERTAGGAPWRCYEPCACAGTVEDPAVSAVLAAAVAGGQVVHPDRAALERLVAPADPERLRRREELLVAEVERDPDGVLAGLGAEGLGTAGAPGDGPATALAVVDAAVADAAAGRLELDDHRVVALATVLAEPALRDAALMHCAGPHPAAAEQLWAALTRETPDPEAAEPAALLAVSAMLRGDGALANVALARAESAWPGHRLTALLRLAVDHGVRPGEIRTWLTGSAGGAGREPQPAGRRA